MSYPGYKDKERRKAYLRKKNREYRARKREERKHKVLVDRKLVEELEEAIRQGDVEKGYEILRKLERKSHEWPKQTKPLYQQSLKFETPEVTVTVGKKEK